MLPVIPLMLEGIDISLTANAVQSVLICFSGVAGSLDCMLIDWLKLPLALG